MLLGCIGDDFTGSSDLANTLVKQGMRTTQYCGVPHQDAAPGVEAGIVALKSRTIPAAEAIEQSLAALEWLIGQACQQFFFKYCSTFDSTKHGNIGPVADALIERLGADRVIVCPAFPATGRSVYNGHLFIDDRLLNQSGMENHPLTPMADPDIRRWLAHQTRHTVGHIDTSIVFSGANAIRDALNVHQADGNSLIVVDAIDDQNLIEIGTAAEGLPLVTGGSGVALGLPDNFRRNGLLTNSNATWQGSQGRCAILSGSCSNATLAQVAYHRERYAALEIQVGDVLNGKVTPATVSEWLLSKDGLPLAYSSADPENVKAAQARYGREVAATAIESLFANTANLLVQHGATRIITAGGETSGAVVEGLNLNALEIGPEIDPGVPAVRSGDVALALKSGNFGTENFFEKAAKILEGL